jgi:hypothetical protein
MQNIVFFDEAMIHHKIRAAQQLLSGSLLHVKKKI